MKKAIKIKEVKAKTFEVEIVRKYYAFTVVTLKAKDEYEAKIKAWRLLDKGSIHFSEPEIADDSDHIADIVEIK